MGPSIVSSMGTRIAPPPRQDWIFLAEWRRSKRFSQEALGAVIGVDKSTISRYETGERRPDIEDLFRLAAALEIRVLDLFRDPLIPSLDDIVARLSEDDRRRATEFVDALSKTAKN